MCLFLPVPGQFPGTPEAGPGWICKLLPAQALRSCGRWALPGSVHDLTAAHTWESCANLPRED